MCLLSRTHTPPCKPKSFWTSLGGDGNKYRVRGLGAVTFPRVVLSGRRAMSSLVRHIGFRVRYGVWSLIITSRLLHSKRSAVAMSLRLFPRFAAGLTRPTAHPRSMVRHVATTACRASPTRSPPPRVGSQQFFTPLRPKASFGSSTTHSAARSSWAPVSFTSTFLRRAFATGRGPRPGYIQMGGRRPPPPGFLEKLRRRADSWDPTKVVYALIAINVGIYLLWKYAVYSYVSASHLLLC